jgi:hypothetical protein
MYNFFQLLIFEIGCGLVYIIIRCSAEAVEVRSTYRAQPGLFIIVYLLTTKIVHESYLREVL